MNTNEFAGKSYWFYLHPYTFVSAKPEEAMLYNTLSGRYIINRDEMVLMHLLDIAEPDNNYVIKLDGSRLNRPMIEFVEQVREAFMGDFYEIEDEEKKPVQFFPKPVLELKTEDELSGFGIQPILAEDNYENYLYELTLQITNECELNCSMCGDAFKQFTCCRSGSPVRHLPIGMFQNLLTQLEEHFRLHTMNITGGDLFKHPDFSRLVKELNQTGFEKHYYFHYINLARYIDHPDFPLLFNDRKEKNTINILVDFPVEREEFEWVCKNLQGVNIPTFHFAVQSDNELGELETILTENGIDNFTVKPYYNGQNLDFFQENVFIKRDFIDQKVMSMRQIHANREINPVKIRKLGIACTGEIYSDMNHGCLGHLDQFKLIEIIGFSFNRDDSSWRHTRSRFRRCSDCVFQYFCPPISNYEMVIDRPSLCWKSIDSIDEE